MLMLNIALHDICLQCFIFEFLHFSQELWPDLKIHRNEKHQFMDFVVYSGKWDSGGD